MDKKYYYEYDSECNVLIRMTSDALPEIIRKNEPMWRQFNESDEQYSRAIYLGQGCWQRLDSISEEEANKILTVWTQMHN